MNNDRSTKKIFRLFLLVAAIGFISSNLTASFLSLIRKKHLGGVFFPINDLVLVVTFARHYL